MLKKVLIVQILKLSEMKAKFNRFMYLFFVIVGLLSLLWQQNLTAVGLLGLAIVFDPFNVNQSLLEKPSWQKAVFLIQALLVVGLFIPLMYNLLTNW